MAVPEHIKTKFRGKAPSRPQDWTPADRQEFRETFQGRKLDADDYAFLREHILLIPNGTTGDDLIEAMHAALPAHVRLPIRLNKDGQRCLGNSKLLISASTYEPVRELLESLTMRGARPDEFPEEAGP